MKVLIRVMLLTLLTFACLSGSVFAAPQKEESKLIPQKPLLDTQIQGGTDSTQLQGGTNSTQLQGGTSSTQLQGEARVNTLSLEDWQKMDLKGFTNETRLMPAIPASVRFVATNAKLDENILKGATTKLEGKTADQEDRGARVMMHLVRCPPADPNMRMTWRAFEREMRTDYRAELWRNWEEEIQRIANSYWKTNSSGKGVVSYHLVVDERFNLLEITGQDNDPNGTGIETAARRTLDAITKSGIHFPANSGVERVHIRVTFFGGAP